MKRKYKPLGKLTAEQQELVTSNLPLAHWYIAKYIPQTTLKMFFDYDDIFQSCVIGLCIAAQRFNPSRGAFSGFAVWQMRNTVNRAARYQRGIRHSEHSKQFSTEVTNNMEFHEFNVPDHRAIEPGDCPKLELKELRAIFDSAITALESESPHLADIIKLVAEGHSCAEISRELGCSKTTIENRLRRAKQKLRLLVRK